MLFVKILNINNGKGKDEVQVIVSKTQSSESSFRKRPKIPSEDFRTRQTSSLFRFAQTMPARRLERFSNYISSLYFSCVTVFSITTLRLENFKTNKSI